ncbi:hypothetical protein V8C42DRAFT_39823 [Trichoderma barbatum]
MSVLPLDASGVLAYLSFPGSTFLVSAISWFSLALGLVFIVPFIIAVIFDFLLWIWRTYWCSSAQTPDAQIPAVAGSAATIVTATAIGSDHDDQRARRR